MRGTVSSRHLKGPSVIKMHLNIFSKQSVFVDGVPLTHLGILHTAWLPPVCVRSAGAPFTPVRLVDRPD